MPNSKELMEKFQADYHLEKSIVEYEEMEASFRRFSDFSSGQSEREATRIEYVNAVKYFVDQHVKYLTSYRADFRPNELISSIENLVQDYEKIMQTRHEETKPNVPREEFEGTYPAVWETIKKSLAPNNKPLSQVWAKGIMKNTIDIDAVREQTNQIHQNALEEGSTLGEEDERAAETAIMMYRTMQEVVKKRGFFWGILPWNWDRKAKEKEYLKELEAQVKTYEELGIKASDVYGKYDGPIYGENLEGIIQQKKADYIAERKRAAKAARSGDKEKISNIELGGQGKTTTVNKAAEKVSAVEKAKEIILDNDFGTQFVDQLVSAMPAGGNPMMQRLIFKLNLNERISNPIQKANAEYDKGNGKEGFQRFMKGLYKAVFTLSNEFGFESTAQRLAAAQIVVDKAMATLSPAGYDPEYAEFANGYLLKKDKAIHDEMEIEATELEGAKKVYEESVPEKLNVSEVENVNEGPVSEPIEKPPVVSALSINATK